MDKKDNHIRGNDWLVRLYRDEDKSSILKLSKTHYKEREQAKEEYFDWLRHGGPAGESIVAVGEEISSGEIIGFAFYVPFLIRFGDANRVCHLGCNALVKAEYRPSLLLHLDVVCHDRWLGEEF